MSIRNTHRSTCYPIIPFNVIGAEQPILIHHGLLTINLGEYRIPQNIDDLGPDEMREFSFHLESVVENFPMNAVAEQQLTGQRTRIVDGNFASSLLETFTAGEMFLDLLLQLLAWEEITFLGESLTIHQVADWFKLNSTLQQRVVSKYQSRLRGGWDSQDRAKPLFRWMHDMARLRNRIVHAGYVPTETEVVGSEQALQDVIDFAKDLLCDDQNRNRHPRTALMIVSVPGLKRRGKLTRRLQDLLDTDEVLWYRSFNSFRHQLQQLIT